MSDSDIQNEINAIRTILDMDNMSHSYICQELSYVTISKMNYAIQAQKMWESSLRSDNSNRIRWKLEEIQSTITKSTVDPMFCIVTHNQLCVELASAKYYETYFRNELYAAEKEAENTLSLSGINLN
jgi:hypothetical protein